MALGVQERCEGLAKELVAVDGRLQACMDVAALRKAGALHAGRQMQQQMSSQLLAAVAAAAWLFKLLLQRGSGQGPATSVVCTLQACSMLLPQPRCWRRSWQAAPTLTQHSTA